MEAIIWSLVGQALIFYCGYKLGQHITAMKITRMLIDRDPNLERNIELARKEIAKINAKESLTEPLEPLRVERINDQLYIYQQESNEFLGQGSTLQEALERIQQRFPDREFKGHLSKDQAESLGISAK